MMISILTTLTAEYANIGTISVALWLSAIAFVLFCEYYFKKENKNDS